MQRSQVPTNLPRAWTQPRSRYVTVTEPNVCYESMLCQPREPDAQQNLRFEAPIVRGGETARPAETDSAVRQTMRWHRQPPPGQGREGGPRVVWARQEVGSGHSARWCHAHLLLPEPHHLPTQHLHTVHARINTYRHEAPKIHIYLIPNPTHISQ